MEQNELDDGGHVFYGKPGIPDVPSPGFVGDWSFPQYNVDHMEQDELDEMGRIISAILSRSLPRDDTWHYIEIKTWARRRGGAIILDGLTLAEVAQLR